MNPPFKQYVFRVLTETNADDALSQLDDIIISALVLLDVSIFILETSQTVVEQFGWLLHGLEVAIVLTFTAEYALRLWSCTIDRRYLHPVWGRVRYALTPLAIVDLLAILPYFVLLLAFNFGAILPTGIFRLFRLFRFARFLKIGRYSESLKTLIRGVNSKSDELLLAFGFVVALLVFASSLMYFAEHSAQPEAFPSIPASMWWGVVTLTTVGYGDVYPITPLGKLFGAVLAFLGIGMFALPAGIVASSFTEEFERRKTRKQSNSATSSAAPKPTETAPSLMEIRELAIALDANPTPDWKQQVERNAQLLQYCWDAARDKLGDRVESEESVRSLAMLLYAQALGTNDQAKKSW